MDKKYWDELDVLGQKLAVSKRLLAKAEEYGNRAGGQRFRAEIAALNRQRESIILSIAEFSVAA